MPLFDTHAHYNDDAFDQNRKGLLDALPDAGVGAVVIPGVDVESSRSALALAESRPWLFAAAGIHPEDCAGCTAADFSAIRDLCREKKVVAIGEIGLDYYWAENPPKEFQQMVFRRQLELALELELPVIVHDREAHGDSLEIVKEFPGVRGVFHCFSGSPEMAEELLKRGWYLGFDGPVTYKNARRAPEVVAVTPLDRIVVETDAPYMSPVPTGAGGTTAGISPTLWKNWRSGRASPRRRWRRTPGTMACGCLGWRGRYEKSVSDGPGLPVAGGLRRAVRDSDANGLLAGFRSGGNQ